MKIKSKLTLRYTGVTAIVFSIALIIIYILLSHTREKEFYNYLTHEAITKANLFLSEKVDAKTMQSIYHNNRLFINEVEVAVYSTDFELIYHDAVDIDIIKETKDLLKDVVETDKIHNFYIGNYQGVAMEYNYNNDNYIITAAAYDGYGYTKLNKIITLLITLWLLGLIILAIVGYFLAKGSLSPVSKIVDEVDIITESRLSNRLPVKEEQDELDELSDTFNRMLNRLEESFNNQKMFVSNVAHELRTPLAALIGELEIALLKDRTTDEYKDVINNALLDAKNIQHLTTGLLNLARVNYDSTQISKSELRLDEILLDAREVVLKAHNDYNINIIFDNETDDESLITVNGNEYLLKTAFVNLMENNCKFSENKSSNIHISYFENNSIIRFVDSGIGIPSNEIEHIFTPFYRGDNCKYTKGQGIGMALTKKIVLIHKGKISVNSVVNEGTTFIVSIPHI